MTVSFSRTSEHTARKPHRCDYCCATIEPGTRYHKVAGVWEGEFYTGKGHIDCRGLWLELYDTWASDEGMDPDIANLFVEAGDFGEAKKSLDAARDQFPEAVARIEARIPWAFDKEGE